MPTIICLEKLPRRSDGPPRLETWGFVPSTSKTLASHAATNMPRLQEKVKRYLHGHHSDFRFGTSALTALVRDSVASQTATLLGTKGSRVSSSTWRPFLSWSGSCLVSSCHATSGSLARLKSGGSGTIVAPMVTGATRGGGPRMVRTTGLRELRGTWSTDTRRHSPMVL